MKRYTCFMVSLFLVTALMFSAFSVAQAAKKPIEFRWAHYQPIRTLDPAQMANDPSWSVGQSLYDTLVFPDVEKKYVPWIAKSWKVSEDGLKYTFYLNKGIPFHDGTEITAEDVAFSMERMLALKESGVRQDFTRSMKPGDTRVLDKYTVELNLTQRDPAFMAKLFLLKILSKNIIMKNKEEGNYGEFGDYGLKYLLTHDAGSGPYMAVEHKIGDYFKMKRFEQYPLEQWKPNSIDIVTTYIIPESVTLATKFKSGELDQAGWALPAKIAKEFQKDKNFFVSEDLVMGTYHMDMNNKAKPLDDPYVRKACAHAFNYEVAMNQIFTGGEIARGFLPKVLRAGCEDILTYDYDLEKAKAMLKKSKYSAEELKQFEMELGPLSGNEMNQNVHLMLYSNLKKIGLNPKIVSVTWAQAAQRAQKPETALHFFFFRQSGKVPHPLHFLDFFTKKFWGTAYPLGGLYYSNPKVEEALEKAAETPDPKEQDRYYCIAQKQIAEDCPAIFAFTEGRLIPFWRYVKGYKYPVGCEFWQWRFSWFTMDTEDPLFRKNHGW